MKSDPLASLLRLRRLTADQARRELADCLRAESEAKQAIAAIDAEIARETEVATSLAGGDAEVEAFAAWLRRIRPSQHGARVAEAATVVQTTEARAVLAMARAAVRAVEELLTQRGAEQRMTAEHQAQREIDEVAQRAERQAIR
jgi:flagellar biosynthesis chaperone FliJ